MRSFLGRDILSLKDFSRDEFFRVFQVADDLRPFARDRRNTDLLKNKTLLTAFYQPSTRTRLSHEAAMHRLGGHVLGFSDSKMTLRRRTLYQESIKDTFHMLSTTATSSPSGTSCRAPPRAAKWASVRSSTAATAGASTHPVLTDLYTNPAREGVPDGSPTSRRRHRMRRALHPLALSQFDDEASWPARPHVAPARVQGRAES